MNRKKPKFIVEADKGFFYSDFDDSFVCQKKNHFQITTYTYVEHEPTFCKLCTETAYHEIDRYELALYGVRKESLMHRVDIKQSDSDRKQSDYVPAEVTLVAGQVNKCTKMRLHFAQTTNNNNKKRLKSGAVIPNPDQRYFLLVVDLLIRTKDNRTYTLCSNITEKFIVRVSFIKNSLF